MLPIIAKIELHRALKLCRNVEEMVAIIEELLMTDYRRGEYDAPVRRNLECSISGKSFTNKDLTLRGYRIILDDAKSAYKV